MRRVIRTPEDIFREEHRDVYAIEFIEDGLKLKEAMRAIEKWLTKKLPLSKAEKIAPSVHSGWLWLEGAPRNLSINFSDVDLIKFFEKWLTLDGQSKDPRFICRFYSYSQWWQKHGHYMPTLAKPSRPNVSLWIETPLGILSHVISDKGLSRHPSTVEDIWANACKKWPQLQQHKLKNLRHGNVDITSKNPVRWSLVWEAPYELWPDTSSKASWDSILDWLCLPENTPLNSLW